MMSVTDMEKLLNGLLDNGIKISVRDEDLVIKGNSALLTKDVIHYLKQNKFDVMARIKSFKNYQGAESSINDSFAQQGHLIKLRSIENRPIIFLVHPIGGSVACYYSLVDNLPCDYSVYAIQAIGLNDGLLPLTTVNQLSSSYEEIIRSEQKEGPYYLAGWSFGGIVAYDLACEIVKKNNEVKFLGLIDSTFPWGREESLNDERFLMNLFISDLFGTNTCSKQFAHFIEKIDDFKLLEATYEYCLENNLFNGLISYELFLDIFRLFKCNNKAHIDFKPKFIDLPTCHFVADEKTAQIESSITLWKSLTNNQQAIKIVPGNHFSIFSSKNIKHLAFEFNSSIVSAMTKKEVCS